MPRSSSTNAAASLGRTPTRFLAAGLLLSGLIFGLAGAADPGVNAGPFGHPLADQAYFQVKKSAQLAVAWYNATPPADRVTWGGLGACAVLGSLVMLERTWKVRRRRITPKDFMTRFTDRLVEGKLDRHKALDLCELNPSPAARVALAAVRRWGRPTTDLDRAVALAVRVEVDQLRRNVGTLRRIAALAPLLGLLGSLLSAGRSLTLPGATWAPALGTALGPLTAGVALAILALVIYDGLVGRIEKFSGALDRLGAETIDAIAMSMPLPDARPIETRRITTNQPTPSRGPHPIRVEIPDSLSGGRNRDRNPRAIDLD